LGETPDDQRAAAETVGFATGRANRPGDWPC